MSQELDLRNQQLESFISKEKRQKSLIHMKEIEKLNLEVLYSWIQSLIEDSDISHRTRQLIILYINQYYLHYEHQNQSYQLVALAALSLAIKFNESYSLHLPINELGYKQSDLIDSEFKILRLFEWNLNIISPSDFYHFTEQQDELTKTSIEKINSTILYIMMQSQFNNLKPSEVYIIAFALIQKKWPCMYFLLPKNLSLYNSLTELKILLGQEPTPFLETQNRDQDTQQKKREKGTGLIKRSKIIKKKIY